MDLPVLLLNLIRPLQKIDTHSVLNKMTLFQLDSLLKALSDTLALVQEDSLRKPILADSLEKVKMYLQYKTPRQKRPSREENFRKFNRI